MCQNKSLLTQVYTSVYMRPLLYLISYLVCACLQVSQLIAHVWFVRHDDCWTLTSNKKGWKGERRRGGVHQQYCKTVQGRIYFQGISWCSGRKQPYFCQHMSQNDIFTHDPSIKWLLVMTWQVTFSNKRHCSNHLCGFFLPPLFVWFLSRWERLFYNRLHHS